MLEDALGYHARRIVRYVAQPNANGDRVSLTLARLSPREFAEIEARLQALPGIRKADMPDA